MDQYFTFLGNGRVFYYELVTLKKLFLDRIQKPNSWDWWHSYLSILSFLVEALMDTYNHHLDHHIRFRVCLPCFCGLDGFLWKTSAFLSLASSLLNFLSFRSLLITSFHAFLACRVETTTNLEGSTFTIQNTLFSYFWMTRPLQWFIL